MSQPQAFRRPSTPEVTPAPGPSPEVLFSALPSGPVPWGHVAPAQPQGTRGQQSASPIWKREGEMDPLNRFNIQCARSPKNPAVSPTWVPAPTGLLALQNDPRPLMGESSSAVSGSGPQTA